jgi:glyoxylase-like metal-dependent hydrolase (beta-lactamase superfamily II)
MLSAGASIGAYQATLRRLRPLVERAETVIPGHGAPLSRERALRVLEEDQRYLDRLAGSQQPEATPLPDGRRTAVQKRIHQENLKATIIDR